jgi:uncharacterized protein YraI
MTTPLETFRAALATIPDGDVAVTLAGAGTLEITVADFATALDVTRPAPVAVVPAPVVAYQLVINTADLRVHDLPALAAPVVGDVLLNTVVDVYTDTPVVFDGHTWLHVHAGSLIGWCVEDYLKAKTVPVVTPPVTPPAPTPIPVVVTHQAYVNDGPLHVRAAGSTTAVIVGNLPLNAVVDVYSDPPVVEGALTWTHIKSGTLAGWVAGKYLTNGAPPVVTVAPTPVPVTVAPKHRFGLHFLQDASGPVVWVGTHKIASATVVDNNGLANQLVAEGVPYVLARSCGVPNGDAFAVPSDPIEAANYGAALFEQRWNNFASLSSKAFIQLVNEGPYSLGCNAFWLAVMAKAEDRGVKVAIGGFAVGGPEPEQWATMIPALQHAKAHGHIVCLHEYTAQNAPDGQDSAAGDLPYYELRFVRFYNAVPSNAQPDLIIGEFGNWNARNTGTANVISLCKSFESDIAGYDYVKGYNYWTCGGAGNWTQSDITSALPDIAKWLGE